LNDFDNVVKEECFDNVAKEGQFQAKTSSACFSVFSKREPCTYQFEIPEVLFQRSGYPNLQRICVTQRKEKQNIYRHARSGQDAIRAEDENKHATYDAGDGSVQGKG
jgi:hypothetical protein